MEIITYDLAVGILKENNPLKIPTLGNESEITVALIDGQIIITNSNENYFTVDEKYWGIIVKRMFSLDETNRFRGTFYTIDKWSSNEGNQNTVFSPYIVAFYKFLLDKKEEVNVREKRIIITIVAAFLISFFAYTPYDIFWRFNTPKPFLILSIIFFTSGFILHLILSRFYTKLNLISISGILIFYLGISCIQYFINYKFDVGFEITDISMLMVFIFPLIMGNKISKTLTNSNENLTIYKTFLFEFKYLLMIIGIWLLYFIYFEVI